MKTYKLLSAITHPTAIAAGVLFTGNEGDTLFTDAGNKMTLPAAAMANENTFEEVVTYQLKKATILSPSGTKFKLISKMFQQVTTEGAIVPAGEKYAKNKVVGNAEWFELV